MNLRTPAGLALVLAISTLGATEKIDLARITPVPDTQPVPIQDFFRPRLLQEPKLNRTGTHIAAIISEGEDQHRLLVHELSTQKNDVAGADGDKDIDEVTWLNESRLLFFMSQRKMYGLALMAADVGSLREAYPLLLNAGAALVAVPPANRLRPLVWMRYDLSVRRDVGVAEVNTDLRGGRIVNLMSSDATQADQRDARDNNDRHVTLRFPVPGGGLTYRYIADREGQLAFAFTADKGVPALQRLEGDKWVRCPVDLEEIDIVGAGNLPGQLVVVGPRQEGKPRALQMLDAATGQLGDVILQDKTYDFNGWLYHRPATRDIIGAMFNRNGPRSVWFNEDYKNLQKILDGFFPGLVVRLIGSDEAEKIFLVAVYSDRQPVLYHWVDLVQRKVGLIKNSAPWIDPKRMQPMSVIKFKTRDGQQLDAYLTLPAGATKASPPPLVVLCHGGPWARDTWGFDGQAQLLASRGYAVLQPNYRGSTGYNWMFAKEDEWDFWKMHEDVTDATKTLLASGLIDPKRVAIMGGSFGGYLAVAGVANEPDLYRCAVTIAGVFDWENLLRDKKFDQFSSTEFGRLMYKLGDPKKQPDKFEQISPGRHVDRIRVPVFIAGGKDDSRVEIEQSNNLIAGLARAKVPHEKFLVSEEGHGMAHLDKQVELYSRIEAFLEKNLRNAK